ncbi:MAG: DUF5667 domain-containing protein [Actinomycetota bacterium]
MDEPRKERMAHEDLLDEALDALARDGREGVERLLAGRPGTSAVGSLLVAADGARRLLSVRLPTAVRAAHVRTLMDLARAPVPAGAGPARVTRDEWARQVTGASDPLPAGRAAPPTGDSPRRLRRLVLRPVAVLGLVGALAAPSTAAFASNAQPGDVLYGTKLAVEQVRLALERDPAGDVDLHLTFAENRLEEIAAALAEDGQGRDLGQTMRNLRQHQAAAEAGLEDLREAGEPTASLGDHLESVFSKHVEVLSGLAAQADCDPADPDAGKAQCHGLLNALENSQKAAAKHEGIPPGQSGDPGSTGAPQVPPGRSRSDQAPPGPEIAPPPPGLTKRQQPTTIETTPSPTSESGPVREQAPGKASKPTPPKP